jgi:hypothetical protein
MRYVLYCLYTLLQHQVPNASLSTQHPTTVHERLRCGRRYIPHLAVLVAFRGPPSATAAKARVVDV